jgi:FMN phosphatase YigB (HAD superfamily)
MRAVFFDLDGTLVSLPDDFAGLFEAALADHGVRADAERREHYFEAFFDHLEACRGDPYRAAMADLCAAFDLDPDPAALAEAYVEREAAATDLRPGVREALDALAGESSGAAAAGSSSAGEAEPSDSTADTALGVLTNGGADAQRRKLAHHGIADYFDAVVVSGAVGASKPDDAIFAAATDALPADDHVFVADDLERDVLPAQREGFTGVYVAEDDGAKEANGEREEDGAMRADFTVSSLRDVPGLLGR